MFSPQDVAGLTSVVASIPEAVSGPRPVPFMVASHHHGGHLRSQLLDLVEEDIPLGAKAPAYSWECESCDACLTSMVVMLALWTVAVRLGNELGCQASHGCEVMPRKHAAWCLPAPLSLLHAGVMRLDRRAASCQLLSLVCHTALV